MLGQTFIQERVVGGQEFENTAVVGKDAADEGFRLRQKIMAQLIVEIGEQHGIGDHLIEIGQVQPFHREAGDQTRCLGIRQHAPYLLFQHSGTCQLVCLGERQ